MTNAPLHSQEGMKRIHMLNSDSNAMVDRRIVVKLLVTYFQRNQSPEILELMARMLGLSGRNTSGYQSQHLLMYAHNGRAVSRPCFTFKACS